MFWIILPIYVYAQFSNTQCNRENILNEYDCINFVDGSSFWNNSKCVQNTTNQNQTQIVIQQVDTDPTYCNLISISLCASNKNCALIDQKCVHFTGCTPFIENCQNISIQCISNGEQCIEIGKCEEFEDETSCQFDMDGKYCYWDSDRCITANTCEQLPKEFDTDSQCRTAIKTCTVAIDGKGCTQSLQNCSDHQIEIQCKSNLQQTQKCFWNGLKCVDYVCNEAPTTFATDEQCKKFLSTCTTKENGGCITRGSCESAKIKEACITDKDDDKCYWNGEQCVDYLCENAPDTFKTNVECESFQQNCITDGNGCVEFKNCSSAKIEDACTQETCYWYNNICQTIKCSFAPKTLLTNEECNSFLEGCLTKLDGGCMEYSNDCTDYDVQQACEASINQDECYWTEEDDCVERTCENAPLTLKSFDECQNYSKQCIYTDKCVLMTCENILNKDSCISDYKDDSCTYIESCYNKECSLAEFTTAKECNDYLDSCTLDESEKFCTTIPQKCINNTKKSTCLKSLEGNCDWSNNSCQIKSCFTADTTYTTNAQCNQYLEGCIISNTIGCTNQLPDSCSDRLKQENCELNTDECVWGGNICQSRSCTTAKYEIKTITNITCRNYYENCILNNTSDNCQQKIECEQLVQSNCLKDAGSDGSCLWNGLNCIKQDELFCNEIKGATNHNQCQQILITCTVNETSNGCVELQECEHYTTQNQCIINNNNLFCKWTNNKCITISCSDAPDSLSYVNDEQCSTFQRNCKADKNIGGCVEQFINICSDYKKEEDCYKTKESIKQNCFWYNNKCQLANSCVDITFLNNFSTANCEQIMFDCKVNTSQNGCVQKVCTDYTFTNYQDCKNKGCSINAANTQCIVLKDYCGDYLTQQDCYYSSKKGRCLFINNMCVIKNQQCFQIPGKSIKECESIREFCTWQEGSYCTSKICQITYSQTRPKTLEDCQNFDSNCTAQIDREQCTDERDCNSYGKFNEMNACYHGKDGYCYKIWQTSSPATSCGLINETNCIQIWIDYYEPGICEKIQSSCTDNPTQPPDTINHYDITQCIDKTCSNKPKGTNYTHSICQDWLTDCTSTMDGTGCMDMKQHCSDYQYPNCGLYSIKEICTITKVEDKDACAVRECAQASKTLMKNIECNEFLSTCTVGRIGGCEIRQSNCSGYGSDKLCFYDVIGNKCWWNPTDYNCVQLKCENIEKTSLYSTMKQCQSIPNLDCIPRDSGFGCQDNKLTCEEFNTQALCTKNKNDQDCQWFNGQCLTKSCETAPLSYNTIAQCLNYYTLTKCTTKLGGGCTEQQDICDDYTDYVSCTITTSNEICGYNQKISKCQIKSCLTAPMSFTTHQECNSYLNTCTVSVDMQGCQVIPNKCEQMTTAQCYLDKCIVINNSCIERSCQNKPAQFNGDCQTYMNSCLEPTIKCKDTICEYYYLPTDQECNEILDTCTSNGVQCVPRKNCTKYTNEISCVKQLDGKKCQWIESTKVCLLRQCSLAPKTYTLYSQCQEYLNTCTVAINGGCMIFDLCTNYKSLEQCEIDKNKQQCVWDTDKCRYLECKDYTNDCENKSCIVDHKRKGYCMQQLKCSEYEYKQNCIIGTDGSCLWIEDKCYKYSKCQDILFTTHEECQLVSKYCTTDGIQCVPLTTCDQTNTNGGCQIGIDGECIEIFVDDIKQCSKYDSCNQIQFTTHEQCYNIKSKCTSNGIECITLDSCNTYTSEISCVIDNIGKVIKQNQVMSTGKCVWNLESNVCSDQGCSDIQGTTNSECENQLYSCTSDGKICIDKVKCSDVKTEQLCSIAKSQNSYCFWENGKCREIGCVDIKNPNSVQYCKDKNPQCTFDGKDCIEISECNQYKTAITCNSIGSDGMCSWIPPANVTTTTPRNVCLLMDSCEQSSQDQQSCLQAKTLCNYVPPTNTTASFCVPHTCDTYYKINNKCNFIYSWDKSTVTFCQLINNVCTEIVNPKKFNNNECYQLTAYTFTYNTTSNLCTSCAQQRKNASVIPKSAIQLVIFIIFLLY